MAARTVQTETTESSITRGLDMPLFHCTKCHHEWEGVKDEPCAWCQASGKVIDDSTPFARMIRDWMRNDVQLKTPQDREIKGR